MNLGCGYCGFSIEENDKKIKHKNYWYHEMCLNVLTCYECDNPLKFEEAEFIYCDCCVCPKCLKEKYSKCTECNNYLNNMYFYYHNNKSKVQFNYKHKQCHECSINIDKGLKFHLYTPDTIHFISNQKIDRNKNLYIGIELEIQGNEFDQMLLFNQEIKNQYSNYFYLKADGSLNYNGVEIVSYPMDYNFIINDNCWKNVFNLFNKYKMNNTNDCGLHFHLDRKYFDDDNIKSLDYIVNKFFEQFIQYIGREETIYSVVLDKTMDEWGKENGDRYVAFNLENENTVELRFCKSTDDYSIFIERVKFIYALVKMVKEYSFENIIKWNNFKFRTKLKENFI